MHSTNSFMFSLVRWFFLLLVRTEGPVLWGEKYTIVCFFLIVIEVSCSFPGGAVVKNPPAMQEMQETQVQSLGWDDPLE